MDNFINKFISQNGANIELYQHSQQKWNVGFNTSNVIFGPFRGRIKAIIFASRKLQMSAKKAQWRAIL